ncbi:MAG: hypothetical protein ACM3ZV_03730 [Bacillota bacterium]
MTDKYNHMDEAELARLGIRRVERHGFQWGDYVYSNMHDAIAAAKRGGKS